MPSFETVPTFVTTAAARELTEEAQAEIEEIAAHLSQTYGFEFPLQLLEDCYQQVNDVTLVREIAFRVQRRVVIDLDDLFEEERMDRHLANLERAFQHFIDEYTN